VRNLGATSHCATGLRRALGVALYPLLAYDEESGADVFMETCALKSPNDDLCHAIIEDFTVRRYPHLSPG
jgi:hypothetical protein